MQHLTITKIARLYDLKEEPSAPLSKLNREQNTEHSKYLKEKLSAPFM